MNAIIAAGPLAGYQGAFEAKVIRVESGCWMWRGEIKENRYGRWYIGGIAERYAHRLSWLIYRGAIPRGIRVLHHCDVEACVNPWVCLFLGTAKDNTQDMIAKGRDRHNPDVRGERNPRAKLTDKQVFDIRSSSGPAPVLADFYGVSSTMIYFIRKNKSWRHLPAQAGEA